jgi:hypothetical protein
MEGQNTQIDRLANKERFTNNTLSSYNIRRMITQDR